MVMASLSIFAIAYMLGHEIESFWLQPTPMIILRTMIRALVLIAGLIFAPPFLLQRAAAQEPTLLGEFGDWAAYTYTSGQGKVCYAVSIPKSSEPAGLNRDPVFFLISHFPRQGVRNEISTIIGYPFRKDSMAHLIIGETTFELFTVDDGAWADRPERDREIVAALKKGTRMDLKGTSWRGTATKDNYSLQGVSAAVDKIDENCKQE
jgi:Invasion associated locus B (IalB) protein